MAHLDIPKTASSKLRAHIDALEAQGVGVTPDACGAASCWQESGLGPG
ncbi:hypothetical protein SAMN04488490_3006 [Marinobacter sp. LV10R510-11A]|nr:hypothetical protein [Marinobacter sp. LV10R510-11A]SOB77218.1 hypothetical protein SAMN04488490_3006 [Marinobacter sp. LV10R510-11A]